MKVSELVKKIEKDYPLSSAYSFDNTGLNILDKDNEIKSILVCLDITIPAINEAKKLGANLIISHHPVVFNEYKNILNDPTSKRIKSLLSNQISAYSMHTNFDVNIKNGMGKLVYEKILDKKEIKKHDFIDILVKNKYALGDIITLRKSYSAIDLYKKVISKLNLEVNKTSYFDAKNDIRKIAIIPGSGSGDVDKVIDIKPDLFITSDLKHNQILDLIESGISYINATHYGLEKVFIDYIEKYLKSKIKTKIYAYKNELL